ncbi:RNA-binding protein 25-like isoform X2 [Gymnodraco acuticeps]|uniref:RNA-binding protein 25-like isoform X2 n=1 Tax=Gymnodraco acuticeps TaxID=8218 RepID=A0A6P8VR78_GYMAC|nr:RNA-binding protein 25-like isoform X2 [Gymnodraco acuticeps]
MLITTNTTHKSHPAGREAMRESTLMERERAREPVSAMERERTMRNLVDMQRKVEQRQQRDKERQLLRVQEHLSIIQNRKAEEDLLGLKHTDRLRHLTQDLPQEDKNQQKTVVKERLEQLRRERSYVMQSKRARNTAGFKELLGPVALHSRQPNDGAD